jgi:hypothetical protein
MAEWLKAHAWKACVPQGTVGSNPTLSASITLDNKLQSSPPHGGTYLGDRIPQSPQQPRSPQPRTPLPVGYRQGIITAITVLLGFSLLFLRYWDFELPGAWTVSSAIAAVLMALSIALQMVTLWRSLQIKDDDEHEYAKTLRWFLSSAVVLLIAVALAWLSVSHFLKF